MRVWNIRHPQDRRRVKFVGTVYSWLVIPPRDRCWHFPFPGLVDRSVISTLVLAKLDKNGNEMVDPGKGANKLAKFCEVCKAKVMQVKNTNLVQLR